MKFGDLVKKETGVDLEDGVGKLGEFVDGVKYNGDEFGRIGTRSVTQFVDWNRLERWKVSQSIAVMGFCC